MKVTLSTTWSDIILLFGTNGVMQLSKLVFLQPGLWKMLHNLSLRRMIVARENVSLRRRGKSVRVSKQVWAGAIAVAALLAGVGREVGGMPAAHANDSAPAARANEIATTQLSPECAAQRPAYEGRRAFRRIHQALHERRAARVLAIGSSSMWRRRK